MLQSMMSAAAMPFRGYPTAAQAHASPYPVTWAVHPGASYLMPAAPHQAPPQQTQNNPGNPQQMQQIECQLVCDTPYPTEFLDSFCRHQSKMFNGQAIDPNYSAAVSSYNQMLTQIQALQLNQQVPHTNASYMQHHPSAAAYMAAAQAYAGQPLLPVMSGQPMSIMGDGTELMMHHGGTPNASPEMTHMSLEYGAPAPNPYSIPAHHHPQQQQQQQQQHHHHQQQQHHHHHHAAAHHQMVSAPVPQQAPPPAPTQPPPQQAQQSTAGQQQQQQSVVASTTPQGSQQTSQGPPK
jgi:hypothetical protein